MMAKDFKAFCAKDHERLDFDGNVEDYLMHMKHHHGRIPSQLNPGRGRVPWRSGSRYSNREDKRGGTEPTSPAPMMGGGKPLKPFEYKHI